MKILIIQDQLRIGGTERQSLLISKKLAERGHRCVVMTFRPGGHLAKKAAGSGIEIRTLQRFDTGVSLWAPGLRRITAETDPDIILCMGRTANCYAGYLQGQFPEIPVIGSVRTGKRLFPLHRRSLSRVRAVVVNSQWWKDRLLREALDAAKLHVIPNELLEKHPESRYREARPACREDQQVGEDTCVCLNVATFRPGKNHLDLLRIFANLRKKHPNLKWKLWMLGDGKTLAGCRRWARGHGIESHVRFFGYQQDPFPFYAAADLAVSVSQEDSLPNFLLEAQAAGLPVIAHDFRGVRETFVPGKSGILVNAEDRDHTISEIAGMIADPDRRKEFAHAARAFSNSKFGKDSTIEKLEELFAKLANQAD